MRIYQDYRQLPIQAFTKGTVVTIGNFDGVHLGHRHILACAREMADIQGCPLLLFTFEPHHSTSFHPGDSRRLCLSKDKYRLLKQAGAQYILGQTFHDDFARMSPDAFISDILCDIMNVKQLLVGANFHFGANRGGDVRTLKAAGEQRKFGVDCLPLKRIDGHIVSSSRIRQALQDGDMKLVTRMLGRHYKVKGTVARGFQTGRELGFPTVNLSDTGVMHPGDGIYAGRCHTSDGCYQAAIYIGHRPSLSQGHTVEAHLLDFGGDLYHQTIDLEFFSRIRKEQTFDNQAALVRQIAHDIAAVRISLERTA